LDPASASDLGQLDRDAIARVRGEAWPEAGTADELHDALMLLGFATEEDVAKSEGWASLLNELVVAGRAARVGGGLWSAAERVPQIATVHPEAAIEPAIALPPALAAQAWTREQAILELLRGRLESVGPTTAVELSAALAIEPSEAAIALGAFESEGFVLRGRFTPGTNTEEWCERRLLARVHRYTVNRLRSEIEPVSAADLMRFLLIWQRVAPEQRVRGPEALAAVIEQLEGFAAPAAAWESDLLPARLEEYDPAWLDALCLAGRFVWMRLRPPPPADGAETTPADGAEGGNGRRPRLPVRATPIVLLSRERLAAWRQAADGDRDRDNPTGSFSSPTRLVRDYLATHGASFFADIVRGTGLLRTQIEESLGELVATGTATADGFTGLRALLTPSNRRPPLGGRSRRGTSAVFGMESAGRWALVGAFPAGATPVPPSPSPVDADPVEVIARTLLRRYGVVMKRMLVRETHLPPWRDLLRMFRRLEARGEIRGGRFVDGFAGEQFALPEAVGMLRAARRGAASGTLVSVSAADPLNLVGVMLPGERVPALAGNRILFRDGVSIGTRVGGVSQLDRAAAPDPAAHHAAESALVRRRVAPRLRAYLGR
jgi:ATP-dependent Lhr-like helicase